MALHKGGPALAKQFETFLNSLLPGVIKFESSYDKFTMNFLDINMTYNQETKRIETDVHIKPTNIQLFLDWFSNHPYHCKKSIIYRQALRVIMICSTPDKKEAQLRNLRDKFIAVNYPEDVIKKQFEKAQKRGEETFC